jgi:hypothetical protein
VPVTCGHARGTRTRWQTHRRRRGQKQKSARPVDRSPVDGARRNAADLRYRLATTSRPADRPIRRRPRGRSLVALQAAGSDAVEAAGPTGDPRPVPVFSFSFARASNCGGLSTELGTRGRPALRFTSSARSPPPPHASRGRILLYLFDCFSFRSRPPPPPAPAAGAFGRQKAPLEIGEGIAGDPPGRRRPQGFTNFFLPVQAVPF